MSGGINTTTGTDSGVETENENSTDFPLPNSSDNLSLGDGDHDQYQVQGSPGCSSFQDTASTSSNHTNCASIISRKISLDVENPLPPAPPTSPDVHSSNFFSNSSNSNSSNDIYNNFNVNSPVLDPNRPVAHAGSDEFQSNDLRLHFPLNASGGFVMKNREIIINIDPSPSMCEDDDMIGDDEDEIENTSEMEQNHNLTNKDSQHHTLTHSSSMEDVLNHGAFGTSISGVNPCRTVVRFSTPQFLPKMCISYSFEPPPGLKEFMTIQPHSSSRSGNGNSGGYTAVFTASSSYDSRNEDSNSGSYAVPNPDCTALVPYENRELHRKTRSLYSHSWRRSASITSTNSGITSSPDSRHHRPRYDSYTSILKEHGERRLRLLITSSGPTQTINKLLSSGVNPNASDSLGRTPLHLASAKGQVEVVRLLLSYGANPNMKDSLGNTPLHLASCTSHFDVVTTLLRAGTDVSTLDNHGRNPLQLAQSKLRLLTSNINSKAPSTPDSSDNVLKTKLQIQQIIEMMGEYLGKKGQDEEAELLNAFANRFNISSHTREQVDQDVKDLLSKINCMSLTGSQSQPTNNPHTNPPPVTGESQFLNTGSPSSSSMPLLRPARPLGSSTSSCSGSSNSQTTTTEQRNPS